MSKLMIASAAAALMLSASASVAQTTPEQPPLVQDPTLMDPAAPAAQPAEQLLIVPKAVMASTLIGANIYSSTNENIAEVKDVILSPEDGQATHVVVDAGDNDVAIEMSQLKLVATDYGLKLVIDSEQVDLASFPALNK